MNCIDDVQDKLPGSIRPADLKLKKVSLYWAAVSSGNGNSVGRR